MNVYQCIADNNLRNYCYVLEAANGDQYLIDPIDCPHLRENIGDGSKLKAIICTHAHHDHVSLVHSFKAKYDLDIYAYKGACTELGGITNLLDDRDEIKIDEHNVLKVLYTPGHTTCDICLLHIQDGKELALFSGDTLFNAGVGNCHSGDPAKLYESVYEKIMGVGDDVTLFPGHDYMCHNLAFTLSIDAENADVKRLEEQGPLTTMGDEKKVNLFFQCDDHKIQNLLGTKDAKSTFVELRMRRNNW